MRNLSRFLNIPYIDDFELILSSDTFSASYVTLLFIIFTRIPFENLLSFWEPIDSLSSVSILKFYDHFLPVRYFQNFPDHQFYVVEQIKLSKYTIFA